MGLDAATIHVSRDQNHLVWDPAIPAVASVGSGDVVELDCLDASFGQLNAESTNETLAKLDFDRVDQVTGPVAVEGAEPGDTLQIDLLEFEHADWGWTASIPGFGLLADDFPDPVYKVTRLEAGADRVEFWPGHPDPGGAVLRRDRRGAHHGTAVDDPARRPWRQHGYAPPRRRFDAVPAGLPAGCPPVRGRRPCDTGRRRGVGDGHRNADADALPPYRTQGPAPRRAGVPRGTGSARGAAQRRALCDRRHRAGPA